MKKLYFLLLAICFIINGCNRHEAEEAKNTVTRNFYVHSANPEEDEFSRYECGYFLFEDRGDLGHFHGFFVWTKDLPQEYHVKYLPVTITFQYTGEMCDGYRIINIIKIQKR